MDPDKLGTKAISILSDSENRVLVSVISFWEISLKVSIGKFSIKGLDLKKLPDLTLKTGIEIISLTEEEATGYAQLPYIKNHRDPFDRMIIWQAICNKFTIVSKDAEFKQYRSQGLKTIW